MIQYYWAKILKKMRGNAVKNCKFDTDTKAESGSHLVNVSMGKHSFCGYDCEIYNCNIGKFCSIANSVCIGGSRHPFEWVSTSPVFYKGRDSVKKKFSQYEREKDINTYIGNDVWIGEGCYIKAGVHIGDGAVIGMGSVVTKNVDAYAIVAGNPAHFIRWRFEEEVRLEIQKTKWWDMEEAQLEKLSLYIRKPTEFLLHYHELERETDG